MAHLSSRRVYLDCHTHILPQARLTKLVRWAQRAHWARGISPEVTPEEAVEQLRKAGAVRWANLLFPLFPDEAPSLHKWGAELADRYPEMTPFGGVFLEDPEPLGVVQEAIERFGMAGIKFHPMVQNYVPWDERLSSALDYLEQNHRPIYVHTGYEEFYGWSFDRAGLENMLAERPGLQVVLPHIGFPELEWGFSLARRFGNVWLDFTNVAGSVAWSAEEEREGLGRVVREGLARTEGRVMMGTDHPAGSGTIELIFEQLRRLDIPERTLEELLVGTAGRFFDEYGRPRP